MKKLKRIFATTFLFLCFGIFMSCNFLDGTNDVNELYGLEYKNEISKKEWTVIVYMAADNNLESAAIKDIKELESVRLDNSGVNVLALLDRAEGYDGTNDDWTDTRLFEIKYDSSGDNGTIKSKRIECPELDLYNDRPTELDMGSVYTLSSLIDFAKRKYVANHYALIIWGHGTGWRGTAINGDAAPDTKAVAVDDLTKSYMTVPELGRAVRGKGIDIIAFDTCFGAVIENFYELKDCATCLAGTAGVVSSEGFNYSMLLNRFLNSSKSVKDFSKCIADSTETVSVIETKNLKSIADGINNFAAAISSSIKTKAQRDEVYETFFNDVKSYGENYYPSDLFLDVYDLARIYSSSEIDTVKNCSVELMEIMNKSVSTTNKKTGSTEPELGIYFITLLSRNCAEPAHSDYYINGKSAVEKSAFVNEMTGWVPTKGANSSLLDKLFYMTSLK